MGEYGFLLKMLFTRKFTKKKGYTMKELASLFDTILAFAQDGNWKMFIMRIIGGVLIYLAIKKEMEPTLLLPIGFGAILMNFPGVVKHYCANTACTSFEKVVDLMTENCSVCGLELTTKYGGIAEPLETLYHAGIASEPVTPGAIFARLDLSSRIQGWFIKQTSPYHLLILPTRIFSIIAAGLPSAMSCAEAISFSLSTLS